MFGINFGHESSSGESTGTNSTTADRNQFGTNSSSQANQQRGTTTALEDPQMSAFRRSLISLFGDEYNNANKPVYGDQQKAAFMSQSNGLAKAATDSLAQTLASRGALNSGAFQAGVADIYGKRNSDVSNFFSQIPLLNDQNRTAKIQPLLQGGAAFAGNAPISQAYSGDQQQQQTGNFTIQDLLNQLTQSSATQKQSGNKIGVGLELNPLKLLGIG